jgi:hypothetical protein
MEKNILKKHNAICDAITDYSLTAEKLLNAVYHTFEGLNEELKEKPFEVAIADLKSLIGIRSDGNNDLVFDALKELQIPQSFRNFEYKGREIKYFSGPLLTDLTIWKDNQNFASLTINPKVIEALKIRAGYTPLELQIVEKFRTKTGYKLYQMWRRYYSLPNHEAPLPLPEEAEPVEKGVIKKGMDELNAYLGMKYEHASQLARTIQRGLDEIEKISNEKILLTVDKRAKEFKFVWLRPVEVKVYVDGSEFSMSFMPRFIVALDSQVINNDMKEIKKEAIKLAQYHSLRLDSESLKIIKAKLKEYRKRNSLLV